MINPLSVATAGYLDSPLSIVADGYIYLATVQQILPDGSGGKQRKIKGKTVDLIKQQMMDDEIILEIVMIAVSQGLI